MSSPLKIRIRNIRCVRQSAIDGPNPTRTGGKLITKIDSGFTPVDAPCTAEGFVTITVRGLPSDATGEDDFAFEVDTKIIGRYQWNPDAEAPNFEDKEFADAQLQSLYVSGVMTLKELGLRMGFSGLNLFWDIRRHSDPQITPEKVAQPAPVVVKDSKQPAKKRRTKKSTSKT